jgi:hypothetical protein
LKKINGLYCHFLKKKNWKTPFININDVDLNLECIFLLSTIRVLSIFSKLSVTTTLPELPVQYCLPNAATFAGIPGWPLISVEYAPYFSSSTVFYSKERLKRVYRSRESLLKNYYSSYGFNYYLQLLCLQFLSKIRLYLLKFTYDVKVVLFL